MADVDLAAGLGAAIPVCCIVTCLSHVLWERNKRRGWRTSAIYNENNTVSHHNIAGLGLGLLLGVVIFLAVGVATPGADLSSGLSATAACVGGAGVFMCVFGCALAGWDHDSDGDDQQEWRIAVTACSLFCALVVTASGTAAFVVPALDTEEPLLNTTLPDGLPLPGGAPEDEGMGDHNLAIMITGIVIWSTCAFGFLTFMYMIIGFLPEAMRELALQMPRIRRDAWNIVNPCRWARFCAKGGERDSVVDVEVDLTALRNTAL